jgi:hypothetical protein
MATRFSGKQKKTTWWSLSHPLQSNIETWWPPNLQAGKKKMTWWPQGFPLQPNIEQPCGHQISKPRKKKRKT